MKGNPTAMVTNHPVSTLPTPQQSSRLVFSFADAMAGAPELHAPVVFDQMGSVVVTKEPTEMLLTYERCGQNPLPDHIVSAWSKLLGNR